MRSIELYLMGKKALLDPISAGAEAPSPASRFFGGINRINGRMIGTGLDTMIGPMGSRIGEWLGSMPDAVKSYASAARANARKKAQQ
jgi:hypothetical protein